MAAFIRIFLINPVSFIAACLAAAGIVVFGLVKGMWPPPIGPQLFGALAGATMAIGIVAAIPMLIAMLLAEFLRWRSIFYWLAVGALIALLIVATPWAWGQMQTVAALIVLIAWLPGVTEFSDNPVDFTVVAFAAGFVGGFVYWLMAGRFSGDGLSSTSPE